MAGKMDGEELQEQEPVLLLQGWVRVWVYVVSSRARVFSSSEGSRLYDVHAHLARVSRL